MQRAFRARVGAAELFDRVEIFDHVADKGHGIGMGVEIATFVQRVGIDHGREMAVFGAEGALVEFAGLVR